MGSKKADPNLQLFLSQEEADFEADRQTIGAFKLRGHARFPYVIMSQ